MSPYNGGPATSISFAFPQSAIFDGAGGFYLTAGYPQHSVYRVNAGGAITRIAGNGSAGYSGDDGPAAFAQLTEPVGLALDASGNLFIAEQEGHRVRKVTPGGVISTVAGTGTGGYNGDGGPAASAQLYYPVGLAVDASGALLIADSHNHRIRKVTPDGQINTVAGVGVSGFAGDNGPAIAARINHPTGVALDGSGNMFIADFSNYRVRKVSPAGVISTVAGNGVIGGPVGDGGPAVSARLNNPFDVALDGRGNLLIADTENQRIRKVTADGTISTVAGNGTEGFEGDNGEAVFAVFDHPLGLDADQDGNLLIADGENYRIRKIDSSGYTTTVAGAGTYGFGGDNGPAISGLLSFPTGVALDNPGNLLIADTGNDRIRKVTPSGTITTLAGIGLEGFSGDGGPAVLARLNDPVNIAAGPDGTVYFADCNNRVRKIDAGGVITTFIASTWDFCSEYFYYYYNYKTPRGAVAFDSSGNLFVADTFGHRVFKVTPSGIAGVVAGTGTQNYGGDGGAATSAQLHMPWGIALDAAGNLFIADSGNHRIRKVTPSGIISTVAGTGQYGYSGDGGPAVSAQISEPWGMAVDGAGNLYFADTRNHRVRKVTAEGIISTVAGIGTAGWRGDGGPPTLAELDNPSAVAVDAAGNLYIADMNNHRIRKVTFALTPPTLAGIASDFAAQGATVNVTLTGSSLASPLTIDAGSGITVSNVIVLSGTQAAATLTIATDAATGGRTVSVATGLGASGGISFTVVPPFPDLSISSAPSGALEVGFNGNLAVRIVNRGLVATSGPMTVTDELPDGLTFVSGNGIGWSCSADGQNVSCANPDSLPSGSSTTVTLTVAAQGGVSSRLSHSPTVSVDGDLISSDNAAPIGVSVVTPSIDFQFSPGTLVARAQAAVGLKGASVFTHDVTGTLTLVFSPSAVIPSDDPAIQFASGGRVVNFTIPANTLQARFDSALQAGPIAFQTGTVAGVLSFNVTLQTGAVQTAYSSLQTIPRGIPVIHSVQRTAGSSGAGVSINLFSTAREVTQMKLQFHTSPAAVVGCGATPDCVATANTLTLDVKPLFDAWFLGDALYGSTSVLRVPLSIQGTVNGSIQIWLRNSMGFSFPVFVQLP
jgi:sugar lactone lactonase YvrE